MNYKLRIHGLLGLLITSSLNLLIAKSLYLTISSPKILLLSMTIWMFVFLGTYHYTSIKKSLNIILILGCFILLSAIPSEILMKILPDKSYIHNSIYAISNLFHGDEIREFLIWMIKYPIGLENIGSKGFQVLLSLVIFLFTSLYHSIIIIKGKKTIYMIIPIVFYYIQWIRDIQDVVLLFNIYFIVLMVFYIGKVYENKINELRNSPCGYQFYNYRSIIINGIIMISIIVAASNIITTSFYGSRLNAKIADKVPSIINLGERGYREKNEYKPFQGRLGGSIEDDDTLVMLVKSDVASLYLRGAVKSIYTGYNWKSENKEFIEVYGGKLIKENDSFEILDKPEITNLTIYPKGIQTTTIYAPYMPVDINMYSTRIFYNGDMEIYYKKRIINFGSPSYEISSIIPNINEEGKIINIRDDREIIRDKYLQLPEKLPERIVDISKSITEKYNSDYEKMKALEGYLRNNHEYSLRVSEIPKERDFIDYFLFDDKRGYCTYYASSLAVMGRTLGIPTRYIEGFVLPREPSKDGLYEITSNRAHAWVEAYIQGSGWVSFEPTTPYETWNSESGINDDIEETTSQIIEMRESSSYDDLKRRLEEENNIIVGNGDFSYESKRHYYNIGVWLTFLLFALTSTRIIYILTKYRLKFLRKNYKNKVIEYYNEIASLYTFLNKYNASIHSPREMLIIISKNLIDKNINDDIIDIVNRSLYSQEDISVDDLSKIRNLKKYTEKRIESIIGRRTYYYHKYILGDIYDRLKLKE